MTIGARCIKNVQNTLIESELHVDISLHQKMCDPRGSVISSWIILLHVQIDFSVKDNKCVHS